MGRVDVVRGLHGRVDEAFAVVAADAARAGAGGEHLPTLRWHCWAQVCADELGATLTSQVMTTDPRRPWTRQTLRSPRAGTLPAFARLHHPSPEPDPVNPHLTIGALIPSFADPDITTADLWPMDDWDRRDYQHAAGTLDAFFTGLLTGELTQIHGPGIHGVHYGPTATPLENGGYRLSRSRLFSLDLRTTLHRLAAGERPPLPPGITLHHGAPWTD